MNNSKQAYTYYKQIFKGIQMPFAFVDMDMFNQNTADIIKRAGTKKIRIASKSIRCVELIKNIMASNTLFQGIMCYHPLEAVHLSTKGFDDLLIAYPIYSQQQITAVCTEIKKGKTIVPMVDLAEHAQQLNRIAEQENCVIPICMDIDMSSDFGPLHFGVRRSNITTVEQARKLGELIKTLKNIRLTGIMGYEAQIAGVGDITESVAKNIVLPILKKKSVKELAQRRAAIVAIITEQGHPLRFVNGGGTGSAETTITEACVTELAVGSGFFSPGLFDHYKQFKHLPAAAYAIEITRNPFANTFTCYGGGYTASGSMENNKLPKPYLPLGAKLIETEGAGEVQTPIVYTGTEKLKLGDPIFMRHAKAGELCERFNTLLLVKEGKIINEVKTYRGEGLCFL